MEQITSISELKYAIQLLEDEQTIKGKLLKDEFYLLFESFKPVNLIVSTLKDITSAPYLINNILGMVMGLATGSLSKSLFIGASGNKIKRLLGTALQFGITNVIANKAGSLKALGSSLFRNFFHKRRMKTEKL